MIERDRLIFGATPTRWAAGVPAVAALAGILFAMSFATARGTEIRSEGRDLPSQIRALSRQVDAKDAQVRRLAVGPITLTHQPVASSRRASTPRMSSSTNRTSRPSSTPYGAAAPRP